MTADDLSDIVSAERTEAALNPTRGDVDTGYDPDSDPHAWPTCFRAERDGRQHPPHPGEACPPDPWAPCLHCGDPDAKWCPHGGTHCLECARNCQWCEADLADARDDLDTRYRLENY